MDKLLVTIAVLVIAALAWVGINGNLGQQRVPSEQTENVIQNLNVPWAISFLPDGGMLFTERAGNLKYLAPGETEPRLIARLDDVKQIGEGGLLGVAVHPQVTVNSYIYLYYTYGGDSGNTLNRVVRFKFSESGLSERLVVVDAIPGSSNHNGGRLKFGPDGYLYISTGDAQNPSLAQDRNSLAGKILRVTDEGKAPVDNPFDNLTYSYGHRNPQGLAWDNQGQLWETEHGSVATDELNRIEKGGNYGWPVITGDAKREGMISPVIQSGLTTWAPSGLVYLGGKFYFAGLRGQALYIFNPVDSSLNTKFKSEYGRLREVVTGLDGKLYISTSNRDGRGAPQPEDDKIITIDPNQI